MTDLVGTVDIAEYLIPLFSERSIRNIWDRENSSTGDLNPVA